MFRFNIFVKTLIYPNIILHKKRGALYNPSFNEYNSLMRYLNSVTAPENFLFTFRESVIYTT